jgi:hypothetical protein
LNFLLGLHYIDGTLMDLMWNNHNKFSVETLNYIMEVA